MNHEDSRIWAVILAAGEGSRLKSLTTTASGETIPKQFCSLSRRECFLELALARATAVASRERICAIVAAQHRRWWKAALGTTPTANIFVQPSNRGTAIGTALSLLQIEKRDPEATVILLPSDHHVGDEAALGGALRKVAVLAQKQQSRIFMLGVQPDSPDTELGYIVPKPGAEGDAATVAEFVEKPTFQRARQLLSQGALWNMFIVGGAIQTILDLFDRSYNFVSLMRNAVRDGAPLGTLNRVYAELPSVDFSRDVLCHHTDLLQVVASPSCGWTDLGTPTRVAATVKETKLRAGAVAQLASSAIYLDLAQGARGT